MSSDLFGAPSGKIDGSMPEGLRNSYDYIPDRSIADMAQTDRIEPRRVATGVTRGTQKVINTDGSYMTLGVIEGTEGQLGIAFYSSDGTLISKTTAETHYIYDKDTGKNVMQIGKLPDDTYGWATAASGYNVSDGIT